MRSGIFLGKVGLNSAVEMVLFDEKSNTQRAGGTDFAFFRGMVASLRHHG
jgi:hypothetical protein